MRFGSSVAVATVVLAALSFVATAGPALAECDPDNVIFEDDFEFFDVTWGQPSETVFVKDGGLLIKEGWGQVNFSTRADEADVCVDITILEAADLNESPATIIFWWKDWDNYYEMMYWATGGYVVDRIRNARPTRIIEYVEKDAIKKGLGQTNNFQLRLRPKDATIIANGTELARFKGQAPREGGAIGFRSYALSKYDNLFVSELFE
jgi:hypothetical protein